MVDAYDDATRRKSDSTELNLQTALQMEHQADEIRSRSAWFNARLESAEQLIMAAWSGGNVRSIIAGFEDARLGIRSACLAKAARLDDQSTELHQRIRSWENQDGAGEETERCR